MDTNYLGLLNEIYVIKYGNENLLKNDYAYNWSILPERLKHGYTSGVAFNQIDPYIIYWVVVW